jgi:hypothetical protein
MSLGEGFRRSSEVNVLCSNIGNCGKLDAAFSSQRSVDKFLDRCGGAITAFRSNALLDTAKAVSEEYNMKDKEEGSQLHCWVVSFKNLQA